VSSIIVGPALIRSIIAQTIKNNIRDAETLNAGIKKFIFFLLMMDNKISRPNIPNLV
jgi:hypothetical protein